MKKTTEQFVSEANLIHNNFYDYSLVEYVKSSLKVKIICPIHGEFEQTPNNHLSGQGCPTCGGTSKLTTFEFIEKAKLVHNDFYDYSLSDYKNSKTKVKIICPKHGTFEQSPKSHLNGNGCPFCGGRLTNSEFIEKAKLVHNNFYDYSKVEYTNYNSRVKIICPIHGEFLQTPDSHLRGNGCKKCSFDNYSNLYKLTNSEFIEKAKLVHNDFYDYKNVVYKDSHSKVKIICPKHGEFLQKPNNHLRGQGCPFCKEPTLEKLVRDYFKKNKINFIAQKKFQNLKDKKLLSFDFYIPSRNLLIECNGIQHYKKVDYFGGRKKFLLQKHHDWLKRKYAKKNGFDLLTIPYWDGKIIENILEEKIGKEK